MTFLQVVTPECFNRGSTVLTTTLSHVEWVGGPVRNSPGFPPKDGSIRSPVADPLKACGNDGLWQCGELCPKRLKYENARLLKRKNKKRRRRFNLIGNGSI
jgi:hypothetical protein